MYLIHHMWFTMWFTARIHQIYAGCCSLASWQKLDICRCFCHPQLSCRLDQISTDHRWNREASACPAEGLEQGMSLTFRGIQGIISHLAITVHRDYPDHFNCHCVVTTISVPSTFFCQHAVNLGVTFLYGPMLAMQRPRVWDHSHILWVWVPHGGFRGFVVLR